jgi:hypothetical protein
MGHPKVNKAAVVKASERMRNFPVKVMVQSIALKAAALRGDG